jgi:hypothetical protein
MGVPVVENRKRQATHLLLFVGRSRIMCREGGGTSYERVLSNY